MTRPQPLTRPLWHTTVALLPFVIGAIYGYSTLTNTVNQHETMINDLKVVQAYNSVQVNKLDTYELMIKSNAHAFDKFLSRFDEFLKTQVKMNNQLIEINSRQEAILKQLGK